MSKVSFIIPSRNERFLSNTVADILKNSSQDIEIIVVLDGSWMVSPLPDDPRVIIIHHSQSQGMRAAINASAAIARGDYLCKMDAHCMVAPGFDEVLKAECEDNWVVIPRRYSLNAEEWKIDENGKPPRDYHYLCYPAWDKDHDVGMHGVDWWSRGKERQDSSYDVDDTMSAQGSAWFMHRNYFQNHLGGLSEVGYGRFAQEFQEIGNKVWLSGGLVKTNKRTWYAHLHKGKTYGRMWRMRRDDQEQLINGHSWSAHYWMTNSWPQRLHDLEWLIKRFWPVPSWGDDLDLAFRQWREHYGVINVH